jgi:hypothetical protein
VPRACSHGRVWCLGNKTRTSLQSWDYWGIECIEEDSLQEQVTRQAGLGNIRAAEIGLGEGLGQHWAGLHTQG